MSTAVGTKARGGVVDVGIADGHENLLRAVVIPCGSQSIPLCGFIGDLQSQP